ncbi:MAG: DNA replication and repair protein RecF [Bacteroidota bacterium]|jgi:DNA replication and repair protein RecF
MFFTSLTLQNFKNYSSASLSLSPRINCFVGNNGSGKTNILDALHYLSFCKSYFNYIDTQNILHGEDFFVVKADVNRDDAPDNLLCSVKVGHKKVFKRNGKEYDRLADHIGLYPLVIITPADSDIINLGSDSRRRLMDSVIAQYDRIYLDNLIAYNKLLVHRNTLLKQDVTSKVKNEVFDAIDAGMAPLASAIFKARQDFVNRFIPRFNRLYQSVCPESEIVETIYQSQLANEDFSVLLATSFGRDRAVQYTTQGIHKDDFVFQINGYPVKRFGSQGQQKSFLVALKLAQFEIIRDQKQVNPVLLFDDIFDKLDNDRVSKLMKLVSESDFGQIFVTDTDEDRMKKVFGKLDAQSFLFRVENQNVARI